MAERSTPLAVRLLYGFLAREGTRSWSEAAALARTDADLERGILTLDKNKTNAPRAWALRPDVVRALRIWEKIRTDHDPGLFGPDVDERKPAELFRERLRAAGIDRPQLFERTTERRWIVVHSLRDSFITIALANGRSESWIQDRTGHTSSIMINRYRQASRTAAETRLGDFAPLDEAIPELREAAGRGGEGGSGPGTSGERTPRTRRVLSRRRHETRGKRPVATSQSASDAFKIRCQR